MLAKKLGSAGKPGNRSGDDNDAVVVVACPLEALNDGEAAFEVDLVDPGRPILGGRSVGFLKPAVDRRVGTIDQFTFCEEIARERG